MTSTLADAPSPDTVPTDAELLKLWLAGRPLTTRRAYAADARMFLAAIGKPMVEVVPTDVCRFAAGLTGAMSTRARRVAAIRSLLRFAADVGGASPTLAPLLKIPKVTDSLHERILTEEDVAAVIAEAAQGRDRTLLRFLYASGARLAEALAVRWLDVRGNLIGLHGKGSRFRTVVIPDGVVAELRGLRVRTDNEQALIFKVSHRQAHRIISTASGEALGRSVSAHWLRHAHCSHALDHGAPVHLVRETLGHSRLSTTLRYAHARPSTSSGAYLPICA